MTVITIENRQSIKRISDMKQNKIGGSTEIEQEMWTEIDFTKIKKRKSREQIQVVI